MCNITFISEKYNKRSIFLKNADQLETETIYNLLHVTNMAFVRLTLIIYTKVLK